MSDGITDAYRGYHKKINNMEKKIMICGASGTGKTTLAKYISDQYELPYISTSASKLWGRYGFISHKDAIKNSILYNNIGFEYQSDILRNRLNELSCLDSYITDRSFFDNMAYIMLQISSQLCDGDIEYFLNVVNRGLKEIDGLIYIKWSSDIILEDNKKRVINHRYQEMVDVIMQWLINNYQKTHPLNILTLTTWDFETRVKQVGEWIQG